MKKYCIALLAVMLISALLLAGCNFNINNPQVPPSTEGTSSNATVDAAGSDDDFTTDMDILVDLIPSENTKNTENTEETENTEATEATTEATEEEGPSATTAPTQPNETEPESTEPAPPSPTNSNGEIELPIIPG